MANSKVPFSNSKQPPRVALVHDWLTDMGGAERVVLALHRAFPEAPVYTSVFEPQGKGLQLFRDVDIRTTWLQKLPRRLRRLHRLFPVLRVWAFKSLDLRAYDIIISSSSAESKQVKKRSDALHVCYCHTPTRYYWSHYGRYRQDPGFGALNPLIRLIMPPFVWWMKRLDFAAAARVDCLVANSTEVQNRIKRFYRRDSVVIHPPVDVGRFLAAASPTGRREGYVTIGRQVPYKRFDVAVQACSELGLPLTVYGYGPEHARLKKIAGPTVRFIEDADDREIARALRSARALLFPAEEDFGIVQIEALAAGAPIVAFARGGALDVVKDGVNGVLFYQQTAESLITALQRLEGLRLNRSGIMTAARHWDTAHFVRKMQNYVHECWQMRTLKQ